VINYTLFIYQCQIF